MLGVMESYYVVQTGARVSVFDEVKRSLMTGADVARFFNAIGRKAAVGVPGETTFPMGGYFNEFRREGMTIELVRELRRAVTFAIAAAGGDVTAITKNARTFSGVVQRYVERGRRRAARTGRRGERRADASGEGGLCQLVSARRAPSHAGTRESSGVAGGVRRLRGSGKRGA